VVAEAMVMLTIARFVVEKFGGDSMTDLRTSLDAYRDRISRTPDVPVAGGPAGGTARDDGGTIDGDDAERVRHGLTGTDEAGSGGDD
jgi:hypothetical protein